MARLIVALIVVAHSLTVFAHVQSAQAPVRDTRVAPTGPAEISGTLMTDGDQPQPVRRAEVKAFASGAPALTAYTDEKGHFVFRNLPIGRYMLEANKPGFVRSAYGARRFDRPGTPVTVSETDRVHHLQWRMPRGAVITGRVHDEFGQPAQGARVSVQQVRMVNGERTLVQVPMASSILGETVDDRGEFRLFGLPAGDYLVSATPRSIGTGDIRRMTDAEIHAAQRALQQAAAPQTPSQPPPPTTLGFSQVYFPGVLTPNAAGIITVGAGEERGGVDFSVELVRTAALEGMVVTPGGVRPESVQLALTPRAGGGAVSGGLGNTMLVTTAVAGMSLGGRRVNADGTFSYGGVTPGSYTLRASAVGDGGAQLWAAVDVTVDGHTHSGLSLVLQEGLTIAGRLVFDADGVDPPDNFSRARINFVPAAGGVVMMNVSSTRITADGFSAAGLIPGSLRVIGAFTTPEANWILKSAIIKGRDALDLPFELEPGDTITDAVLTFTNRTQQLTGTLSDASQRPAPDFTIVVFPEDRALWTSTRRVRTGRPGTDGRYAITDLPSGTYRMAAVTDIGPEEVRDLALLEELAAASIVFTLGDGETKVQDLRIAR
jgi:hypothetical protein